MYVENTLPQKRQRLLLISGSFNISFGKSSLSRIGTHGVFLDRCRLRYEIYLQSRPHFGQVVSLLFILRKCILSIKKLMVVSGYKFSGLLTFLEMCWYWRWDKLLLVFYSILDIKIHQEGGHSSHFSGRDFSVSLLAPDVESCVSFSEVEVGLSFLGVSSTHVTLHSKSCCYLG
jgi:hypothetical protein